MKVNVALYGSLARFGGGRFVSQFDVELEPGACKADLLAQLGIPEQERGFVFLNSVLCDVPGLTTEGKEVLSDGDHIGVFSLNYMWPYQYRDGFPMSDCLKQALQNRGTLHHSYHEMSD